MDTGSVNEKSESEPAVEAIRQVLTGIDDPHMKRDLVAAGEVDEASLDASARRLLTLLERTGAFDAPLDRPELELDEPAHRALARRASAGSMVLYRNEGVLPFDAGSITTLAVIGPNAAKPLRFEIFLLHNIIIIHFIHPYI